MRGSGSEGFTLRVVDRATRLDLKDVAVHHAAQRSFRAALVGPRDESTRFAGGDSPLQLPAYAAPRHSTAAIVVASPGYAMRRIEVDLAPLGAMEVDLEPGGALSISVEEVPEDAAFELRLHSVDEIRAHTARVAAREGPPTETVNRELHRRSFSERLAILERGPDPGSALDLRYACEIIWRSPFHSTPIRGSAVVEFDQLAPGTYAATLVSDVEGVGYCFGLALARVEPGRKVVVLLRRQARPEPTFLRIHGVMTVPAAWEQVPSEAPWIARLYRQEIDPALGSDGMFAQKVDSELVPTDDGSGYRFDFGAHPLGLYQFELPRFGMALPLLASVEKERRLTIPPPVEVELTILAPTGDRAISDRQVRWATAASYRAMRDVAIQLDPDLADGRYRFVAPQGAIVVEALPLGEHFRGDRGVFDVRPDQRSFTLRTTPEEVELKITLRDGARALARPYEAKLRFERDGQHVPNSSSFPVHGTTVSARLPGPGLYRLTVSGVEGYEDAAPLDVEILAQRRNAVDVPMRRRQ